jgi:exonuclease III
MRVLSWNVQKSSNREGRIDEQISFIDEHDVDVLMLQEVRHTGGKWTKYWTEQLADIGLGEIGHSLDTAAELADSNDPPHDEIRHDNGHITAVTDDWSLRLPEDPPHETLYDGREDTTHFPEKILLSTAETPHAPVQLWNIRAVPANSWGVEKVKIFETVYEMLTDGEERTRLVAGDLNAPKAELPDGQAVPFGYDKGPELSQRQVNAELNLLKGLGHLALLDVFRTQHGFGDLEVPDTSWKNKRFDHLFASQSLEPERCFYDHEGLACSDHAPLIADFST